MEKKRAAEEPESPDKNTRSQYHKKMEKERAAEEAEPGIVAADKNTKSTRGESIASQIRRRNERIRMKQIYARRKLELKIRKQEQSLAKYRQRFHRDKVKSISPRSVAKKELKNANVSPEVKRKLLFNASFVEDVQQSFRTLRSTKQKWSFATSIDFKYTRKYHYLTEVKPLFQFTKMKTADSKKKTEMAHVEDTVKKFYLRDDISTLSPNKSDQIVRKGVKEQK